MTRPEPPAPVTWRYDRSEMVADGVVHVLGVTLAIVGAAVLIVSTAIHTDPSTVAAASIYAGGLIGALTASLIYNLWPVSPAKWVLRRLDHSAIFILIAGTYTPFLVQLPEGATRTGLLAGMWGVAAAGVVIKTAFPGRYDRLAILAYLGMGWSGAVAYPAIFPFLPAASLTLIVVGGVVYSAGVVFHLWESLRFQNAIWHAFVLAGAAVHYVAVYTTLVA